MLDVGVRGRTGSVWTKLSQLSFAHQLSSGGLWEPQVQRDFSTNIRSTCRPCLYWGGAEAGRCFARLLGLLPALWYVA